MRISIGGRNCTHARRRRRSCKIMSVPVPRRINDGAPNEMLRIARDTAKHDDAKGIVYEEADARLEEIYKLEQAREAPKAGSPRRNVRRGEMFVKQLKTTPGCDNPNEAPGA